MLKNLKILFLTLFCICSQKAFLQEKNRKKDTTEVNSSTKKNRNSSLFHKAIFRPKKSKKNQISEIRKDTLNHNGKIIRKIKIVTLDPLGFSDTDFSIAPKNWGEKTGNKIHLKTEKFAIKNLLLFRKNTPYSGFKIQESERIIRSQRFVSRVTISEEIIATTNDSIDIIVRVLDSWSLLPRFSISSSKVSAGFNDQNILGTGQQLEYRFTNRFEDGRDAHGGTYTIPNIKNTFIRALLNYDIDLDNNYNKNIVIDRPFYSPLTKWAAGVTFGQRFKSDTLQAPDLSYEYQNFKYNIQDFWVGKAFNISTDSPKKDRTTNLILSARYLNLDYTESPLPELDPIDFFSDEKQVLVGFGLNTREFVKDNYIFRNGNPEDVPVGRIYGITFGYQYKNQIWRPYIGAQASFGDYFDFGFLSTNFKTGTFFYQSKTYQTTFSFQANYFTHLITLGKWKVRQFVKPEFVIGINRSNSISDRLTINENYGIRGFNAALYGENKMVWTFQTQTYSPKEILGFRINPFLNYSIALLDDGNSGFLQNKCYSKFSLGVLINNDYLVFSSFQLSLSYYPTIPFQGDRVFKTNTFQTTDFGVQGFELAKPSIVEYK